MSSIGAMLNNDPPEGQSSQPPRQYNSHGGHGPNQGQSQGHSQGQGHGQGQGQGHGHTHTHTHSQSQGGPRGWTRGAFIVLEGLDRSGKTTQAKLLEQRFIEEGRPVKAIRFPDRTTPIGKMIDEYLKSDVKMDDHAIHLLFSANRWEFAASLQSMLEAGTTVICDRYYHSGAVYSAAKQNPTLLLSWARSPDSGLPKPDVVLFLDLDEKVAKQRGGFGEERYEKAEMQRRVRSLFKGLKTTMGGWLKSDGEGVHVVDAGRDMEEVAEAIWDVVRNVKVEGDIKVVA